MSNSSDDVPKKFHVLRGRNGEGQRTGVTLPDGLGVQRKLGALGNRYPVFQPDDPRIREILQRGGGVWVDLSMLSEKEKKDWWAARKQELLSGGIRTPARDLVREANEQMRPDDERYPQADEDEED